MKDTLTGNETTHGRGMGAEGSETASESEPTMSFETTQPEGATSDEGVKQKKRGRPKKGASDAAASEVVGGELRPIAVVDPRQLALAAGDSAALSVDADTLRAAFGVVWREWIARAEDLERQATGLARARYTLDLFPDAHPADRLAGLSHEAELSRVAAAVRSMAGDVERVLRGLGVR
jgi:hypothetical protein